MRPFLLIVDDDLLVARALKRSLARDWQVSIAGSGREALELIGKGVWFEAILCDLHMPVMNGDELLRQLEAVAPEQAHRVLFMTGDNLETALIRPSIEKPVNTRILQTALQHLRTPSAA